MTQKKTVGTTLGLLPTLALSTACAIPAHAQTAAIELDPIEITSGGPGYATTESSNDKATAPLVDTPQTVNTMSAEEIADRGLNSVEDVLRATPGVTLQAGEGGNPMGTAPIIRGFDANSDISVDGIRNSSRVSYETFNLDSVQVNKGASGTTAGRGSTGGTINLDTKTPQPGNFADVALTYGTGNYMRATLDVNRDFGSGAVRLNLMGQQADDLNGRKGLTSERYGFAPSLTYRLSNTTSITAGLYYYEMHDLPDYGISFTNANTPAEFAVGSGTDDDPYQPTDVDNDNWYGLHDRDFRDNITRSAYARVDHDLANGLTFQSTLRVTEDENVYLTTKPAAVAGGVEAQDRNGNRLTRTVALNAQLSGEREAFGASHNFVVGVDLSKETTDRGSLSIDAPTDPVLSYENPNYNAAWDGSVSEEDRSKFGEVVTTSLYAIDTMTLSPQWEVTAGLRYDMVDAMALTGPSSNPTELEEEQGFLNGNFGVVYHPRQDVSLYAVVSSSADPALGNPGIQTDSANTDTVELDPERSYTYELGAKWLVNDSFLLGASIYRIQKDNERVEVEEDVWELAGDSQSQGIELTFAGQVTDKWSLSGGYSRIDYSSKSSDTDFSRNVPENSFSIWSTYDVNDALTVGGGATYTGERFAGNNETRLIPSSWQVDAMARYAFAEDTAVQVNVTNLFDEDVYGSSHHGQFVYMGPARTVSMTLTKSF
ncbi:TonB-dependent receptor [Poseidonocella sedimentorum]|uniref:Catecholate siderophore receptor n=1 Tax=Poseidonocella sedimentorum TaxID=871652 RepID=A0A1I6E441_9RHOB|nr:TonB-dependent siderophore receptor [Poseidonocella sedimentorum]SFR12529.1 catecholate siderophore receptor [Poseidonocella sedimentorum]